MRGGRAATLILISCVALDARANEDAGAEPQTDAHAGVSDAGLAAQTTAEQFLRNAEQETDAGDLVAAHADLLQAYAIYPDPRLLYNLAQIERAMRRPADAIPHYQQFLREIDRHSGDAALDKSIALAEKALDDLRALDQDTATATDAKRPARIDLTARAPSPPPTGIVKAGGTATEHPPHRPIYRRWQFWTALAGVVGVVGAVIWFSRGQNDCPPSFVCMHVPGS